MKVLWVGDAACSSGFGRATDRILKHLSQRHEVVALGVNYRGDPHTYPYRIYPAYTGGDALGIHRLKTVVGKEQPDLIVLQTNPWNVPMYQRGLHLCGHGSIPVVGILAVEGKNVVGRSLNGLKRAIFWNEFAAQEAVKGGMVLPYDIVPLGVDTDVFSPGDRIEARHKLGIASVPDDAFIVCNVNRNQNRKRLDLSILYFAEWITNYKIRDAYLYLHVLPGSSTQLDCDQLAEHCGIADRLILAEPKDVFHGAPEDYVVAAYRASNVGLTTTLGEGWGLTTMEGLACGRQQIAGAYAAIGEWGKGVVHLVDIVSEGVMPDVNTMIGGVPSKDAVIDALDEYYVDRQFADACGARGRELACEPQFNWANVAAAFAAAIEKTVVA